MKRVLVTGAAGNIGSALVANLLNTGAFQVTAVDNLSTGLKSKLPIDNNLRFVKADVNKYDDLASVFHTGQFEYAFHFAAVVGVKRTLENPLAVLQDIDGIRNFLALSKNCGIKRVFFSSSSEVYGEPVTIPQHEELTPLNSRLPYAIVKNIGEAYFRSYFVEHGLQYTIFRFFNTYGPHQSEDFVIPRFVRAALKDQPITIYGDGSQTRTFCYIDDNVATMARCLTDELHLNDILNIGSEVEYSIKELARIILRITNSQSKIVHMPPLKEGDMSRRKPDNSKMRAIIETPLTSIEQGISRLVEHYRNER